MKPVMETLRNLSKGHRDRIEKAKKIAENTIRTAEAAKEAGRKK